MRNFILVLVVILYSCSNATNKPNEREDDVIVINIDNTVLKISVPMSLYVEGVKVVPLEENESCMLGDINKVCMIDNSLFITDGSSNSLYEFDLNGGFIRKIGQVGNGPGEYRSVSDFSISRSNKTIYVLDRSRHVILKYSQTAEFIKSIPVEESVYAISVIDDKIYLKHSAFMQSSQYLLTAIDESGHTHITMLPYSKYSKGYSGFKLLARRQFINTENDTKCLTPYGETIYTINKNKAVPFLTVATRHSFNNADVDMLEKFETQEASGELIQEQNRLFSDKYWGVEWYFETQDILLVNSRYKNLSNSIIYDKNNKKYVCFNRPDDNISNLSFSPSIIGSNKDYIISYVRQNEEISFIQNVKDGHIKLYDCERDWILSQRKGHNPIILLYKTKSLQY
ncbi:MAG: 6-bladed beta-propeller [Prolixibacteraceae bacterium]|nr:6-bladed beta-propeller [Prolixibacteraceae bacterium]